MKKVMFVLCLIMAPLNILLAIINWQVLKASDFTITVNIFSALLCLVGAFCWRYLYQERK